MVAWPAPPSKIAVAEGSPGNERVLGVDRRIRVEPGQPSSWLLETGRVRSGMGSATRGLQTEVNARSVR